MEPFGALRAIVWAQWRTSRNFIRSANKASLAAQWAVMAIWYGGWVVAAVALGVFVSGPAPNTVLEFLLPLGLFTMFTFWQLMPVIAASQGGVIDLRRLLAFPIPSDQLFLLEVVLRVTTAPEMLLLCVGLMGGLAWNRHVPFWGPLAILPFIAFNLLLAAGVKSVLTRLFQRKGIRELVAFGFVAITILPQLLEFAGLPPALKNLPAAHSALFSLLLWMPWSLAGRLAIGHFSLPAILGLIVWVGVAYLVSRRLFARSLQLAETTNTPAPSSAAPSAWRDRIFRLPAALLPDALGTIAEKDLRSLFRSSRFRLTFLMACAMGSLLWLPAVLRSPGGWMASNYLTMTALYGTLVLGDTLYWNVFGFERASVQLWFVTPVTIRQALLAKNVVSAVFSVLAVLAQTILARLLPVHAGPAEMADALVTIAVFLPILLGGGNLASVYAPRPMDPNDAWRNTGGGKTQLLLLCVFPVLTVIPAMAHLARWAMDCYWIFHAVMGAAFLAGLCFYAAATDTAAEAGELRKEEIAAALSRTEGPVSTGA